MVLPSSTKGPEPLAVTLRVGRTSGSLSPGCAKNTAPGYRPSPVFSSAPCLNSPVRLPSALLTPGSPRSRSPQCPGPSETRRRSGRRPRRRKVRSAPFPPPGEHFTPLPCSSSPNETRCIAVGGFAALQYGVPLAGAALSSRWVPEPPPDADGVTPGWPRSRSPRSRGPSGWRRRSDRRPRRAGPAAHGRSLRSWSRRTGW